MASWAAVVQGWFDLGAWFTLQASVGWEEIPEVNEAVVIWSAAFAKSFEISPLFEGRRDPHGVVPALTFMIETAGEDDEGLWQITVVYSLARDLDVRGGVFRTFDGEEGWVIGVIWHF